MLGPISKKESVVGIMHTEFYMKGIVVTRVCEGLKSAA